MASAGLPVTRLDAVPPSYWIGLEARLRHDALTKKQNSFHLSQTGSRPYLFRTWKANRTTILGLGVASLRHTKNRSSIWSVLGAAWAVTSLIPLCSTLQTGKGELRSRWNVHNPRVNAGKPANQHALREHRKS